MSNDDVKKKTNIEEIILQHSLIELNLFKKIIKPKEYGGISFEDITNENIKKILPLLENYISIKKSDEDEYVEKQILEYLEKSTFNCEFEDIPEIVNNETFYRELFYKQKTQVNKKKEENKGGFFFKSISFVKIFYNFVKENAKKSNLNAYERIKNIPRNSFFFEKMKNISEKLLFKLYSYSNINLEAENKICLHLYIMKNIFTNYCFFFNNVCLENYIKEFKKFKK